MRANIPELNLRIRTHQELAGCLRDKYLIWPSESSNPGAQIDRRPVVVAVAQVGLSGVQAHSDLYGGWGAPRGRLDRANDLDGGVHCV
jgi:hypothetical protein